MNAHNKFLGLLVPVYSVTLLLSAFLLFLVQPLFGKMILPLLGGSPSVWNTAMLFFQVLLLAGYAYAHASAKFVPVRVQAVIHIALLALFVIVLPITIPQGWTPPTDKDPTLWQLALMTVAVGGPFFVLSGSAPILQHWFAHTGHKDAGNPYFLYAASNLGSMSALIAYPILVEPMLNVDRQSFYWAAGYVALIAFVLVSALIAGKGSAQSAGVTETVIPDHEVTWKRRVQWVALAFVPSSLMLGVTTFVTTDLASVPLLWILPLALYVGTFIIAFARRPVPSRRVTAVIQSVLFICLLSLEFSLIQIDRYYLLGLHILLFFFTALMCHQELSAVRPTPRHLTQFYLLMSLGGALGGFFNAILAPNLFISPVEYGLALILAAFMRFGGKAEKGLFTSLTQLSVAREKGIGPFLHYSGLPFILIMAVISAITFDLVPYTRFLIAASFIGTVILIAMARRRWTFAFCALAILAIHAPGHNLYQFILKDVTYRDRNFFGVIKVGESAQEPVRLMLHGTTIHGVQALDPDHQKEPLAYYSKESSLGDVFSIADGSMAVPQKVAVLGLGVGATACYTKEGRSFDFYEIDPAVIDVAENVNLFTYLSDCGSPYEIILGDGRLKIAEKDDATYDVIFLDVFSSDNIPVHVMTIEALRLYKRKLKPNGFIVMNISNRFMDLRRVMAAAARDLDMKAYFKYAPAGTLKGSGLPYLASEFMVLSANDAFEAPLKDMGWRLMTPPVEPSWSDNYSDIITVLRIFQK